MRFVCPIDATETLPQSEVGAKASSLARMLAEGMPVPAAEVVTVEAMRHFLSHNRLLREPEQELAMGDRSRMERLREGVRRGEFPEALRDQVVQAGQRIGLGAPGQAVAVRSSAIDEDGEALSFAGQYVSRLNVQTPSELLEALRECWASWYSEEAGEYRGSGSMPAAGMAVVIQRQIFAKAAGVLFTINPMSGSWGEMVLEACWGQGEALVSGRVRPDRMVLRRPRRTPRPIQRVLARVQVESLDYELGGQTKGLFGSPGGGLEWRDLKQPGEPVLREEDARKIGRMGLHAEALAGHPQDIEWAIDERGDVVVLQSRPITAQTPERGDEVLWTRRFFGERWTEPATPLGWSLVQKVLHEFIEYPKTSEAYLGGAPPTQLYRGRPYFNVTVFRHLLFKFPGAPPPRFLLEFLPPAEEGRWLRRRAAAPGLKVYRSILWETFQEKRWQRFRWNPLSNPKAWAEFEKKLGPQIEELESPEGDPLAQLEHAESLLREYIKIHICSLLFANIFYQVAEGLIEPELRGDLLRCPTENRTQEVNRDLFSAAQTGEMEAFLKRHGHRASSSSWEVFSPRWAEHPEAVERLIRPYRENVLEDPTVMAREQEARSQAALAELKRRSRTPAGRVLVRWITLTRQYLQLREDQRYAFDRLLFAMKGILLRHGRSLWGEEHKHLVAYLWEHELRPGRCSDTLLVTAREREAQWEEWSRAPVPPVFLNAEKIFERSDKDPRLRGLGISSGVHTGRVRILKSPEEAGEFRQGDVLVASATDPGWTPLFLLAGAVVLELGSLLSHGAVLAREYGLPAVVNVPDVLEKLEEGQKITVDGTRGVVWLDPR